MDVEQEGGAKLEHQRGRAAGFGLELTNTAMDSPSSKRPLDFEGGEDGDEETPPKKQRRAGKAKVVAIDSSEEEEWMPPALSKKGKRKVVA